MTNIAITQLFLEAVKDNVDFKDAIKIIRKNSQGNFWLIGGFVYRNIASLLYGVEKPAVDLDFIIENSTNELLLPNSWEKKFNRYGNLKFVRNDGLEIDFVPLTNIHSIIRRGLPATIENFLTGTPLNIQSIVYDVKHNKVEGDIGIKALFEKKVFINNREQAKIYSMKKGKPINSIIKEKASSLGFAPVFIK
jgi:hypothetical protein